MKFSILLLSIAFTGTLFAGSSKLIEASNLKCQISVNTENNMMTVSDRKGNIIVKGPSVAMPEATIKKMVNVPYAFDTAYVLNYVGPDNSENEYWLVTRASKNEPNLATCRSNTF